VRAARIRQWAKNLLVFGAPAAAGALGSPGVLTRVVATFAVFCLLSSGVYLINDVSDAAEDRRHPVKRHRPVASGAVSARRALAAGIGAVVVGVSVSPAITLGLLGPAVAYVLLNVAYTTWLRSIVVADIAAVAGAFVLRALAGAIAAHVHASTWFILVVSLVALFVAAGKRYADLLDPAARRSRRVLDRYSAAGLRAVIGGTCALAVGAYGAWVFAAARSGVVPWRELTIIPFTIVLLRYLRLATAGRGGAPERILYGDRSVQLAGAVWLATFGLGAGALG
jgi:decaprenyl-phosphate phosphoribosyltransferase